MVESGSKYNVVCLIEGILTYFHLTQRADVPARIEITSNVNILGRMSRLLTFDNWLNVIFLFPCKTIRFRVYLHKIHIYQYSYDDLILLLLLLQLQIIIIIINNIIIIVLQQISTECVSY